MKIINALSEGNLILEKNLIKTARLDTEILMSNVINKDRKYIILNSNKKLVPDLYNSFMDLIKQRSKGKPVAYLVRKKDFWKYQFQLNENTLIPRPDTELIIENFLKITKFKSRLKILDIGVGSGCILLSILKEKKDFYGTGIDISKKCINIANLNALNLGLLNRTKIVKSDIDNFNYGKYDVIISNPPYIKKFSLKYLDRDVVNFEPKQALDGGVEGTSEIRKVINKSSELIKKNGKLILEIGFDQKNKTKKPLTNKGFYINKIIKDYANNDRCIISTKI